MSFARLFFHFLVSIAIGRATRKMPFLLLPITNKVGSSISGRYRVVRKRKRANISAIVRNNDEEEEEEEAEKE